MKLGIYKVTTTKVEGSTDKRYELKGTPVLGTGEVVMERSDDFNATSVSDMSLEDLEIEVDSELDSEPDSGLETDTGSDKTKPISNLPLIPQISLNGDRVNTICMGSTQGE